MSKFLIRDDYYKMMLELIELERISVGDYLEAKFSEFGVTNPNFIEILYKDINKVLEGVLKDGEGDLVEENGDWVEEYGDIKLSGPVNNLHFALMGLHQMKVEKETKEMKWPNEFIQRMESFENNFLNIDYNTPEYNEKLAKLNKRLKNFRKGVFSDTDMRNKKSRKPIPQEKKVRAVLQKEIDSQCPFCPSEEVGHFEIHHIDEDPSNNSQANLLLVCPTCHSKITKKDITQNEVLKAKLDGCTHNKDIEIAAVTIDELSCSWKNGKLKNTFYRNSVKENLAPVLKLTVINHSNKTALLWRIKAFARHVFVGINGIPPASFVKPIAQYFIPVNYSEEGVQLVLPEPIQIPSNQSAMFQVTLAEDAGSEYHYFDHATQLNFIFDFNGDVLIKSADLFLNCESKHKKQQVIFIS
jgi:hypothetical protein